MKYDGILPDKMVGGKHVKVIPDDIQDMIAWIDDRRRVSTPFDVVIEGETKSESIDEWSSIVSPWADAGATWWLESMWGYMREKTAEDMFLERVRLGPPSIK